MGEFMMAMIYKNVKNSSGAGDLSFVNDQGKSEEFEIKGHNATLGIKPDASNWFKEDSISKLGVNILRTTVKDSKGKEKLSTVLEYNGKKYKPGALIPLLSKQYNKLNDEEKILFEDNFKQMMLSNVFSHNKDKMDVKMIDAFLKDPDLKIDFSNPRSIHNGIGLLNHVNYVSIHGFDKFLSHDMGEATDAFSQGDYVFLQGNPFEQAKQLKKELENPNSSVLFQDITANLSRPRIGYYKNAIDKKQKAAQVSEQIIQNEL